MGKKPYRPFVSICTPTFNRRPFIPSMIQCYRNQKYPKNRMEWIIIDDGTDPVEDIIMQANIPEIKYFRYEKKMTLGAKRNLMHTKTKGSIIVYMDDDDYYPPERVTHAVETLQKNKQALCAGSSEIYVYFKHINKMYKGGPYNSNHGTAATFAFRRELLDQTEYDDNASVAEEKGFLKNYTIPFVQLDPFKTLLVFSHEHNSFDKKKLLNGGSKLFDESNKKIEDFIRNTSENDLKEFFLNTMPNKLSEYKEGDPSLKPDVEDHIKRIEAERKKMQEEAKANSNPSIRIETPGEPTKTLNMQQVCDLIKKQQAQIEQFKNPNNIKVQYVSMDGNKLTMNIEELCKYLKEKEIKVRQLENQGTPKICITDISGEKTTMTLQESSEHIKKQNDTIKDLYKKIEQLESENSQINTYLSIQKERMIIPSIIEGSSSPTGNNVKKSCQCKHKCSCK